ncbi:MAG: hypothetical protein U0T83_10020 [Bacteriovoracaceae bacterium]
MAHILIISNDDIISALYPLNINLYIGFDVTLKLSWPQAKKLLEAKPVLDLIILLENDVAPLKQYLSDEKIDIPILIIGECKNPDYQKYLVVRQKYNIQDVLKTLAKYFKITAKAMSEKVVAEYYPIGVKFITNLDNATTDIFVKNAIDPLNYSFTKIVNKGEHPKKVIDYCFEQKIDTIYIPSLDRLKIVNDVTLKLLSSITTNSNLSLNNKLELNEQGFELAAGNLTDTQILNEEIQELHKACLDSTKEVIKKIPGIKELLDALINNKSGHVYTHSILISFVCNHIVKNVNWGGQGHSEKLSYISFYHDLHLVQLFKDNPQYKNEEDLYHDPKISEQDKKLIQEHAKIIGEMIAKFPRIPIGADIILKQHHGATHGVGFVKNYTDDISPLAKVFIIAEAYVTEILREQNYPITDKLDFSKINKKEIIMDLNSKFKKSSYRKIIEVLDLIPI